MYTNQASDRQTEKLHFQHEQFQNEDKQAQMPEPMQDLTTKQGHTNITNFHPTLPYVNLTVGTPVNNGPYFECCGAVLKCLLDTGCAKTSIDKKVYEFIMTSFNNGFNELTKSDVQIQGCTGETKPIEGTCKLRIYFSRTPKVYRDIVAMVVDNLQEDMLIGYDIISSPITQAMTKTNWVVRNNVYHSDIYIPIEKQLMPIVPCYYLNVISPSASPTPVMHNKILINSNSTSEMDEKIKHRENFLKEQYPSILKKINFGKKTPSFPIPHYKFNPSEKTQITIKDSEMNAQEKEEELTQLDKNHYFQPSITQYIDDKSAVTELGLVDDRPITKEEFLNLFEVNHLEPKIKEMAEKIFLRNRDAFSTHKYDIGKTNLIEMDIQTTSNEPKMQKYVPIPMNVKGQVK